MGCRGVQLWAQEALVLTAVCPYWLAKGASLAIGVSHIGVTYSGVIHIAVIHTGVIHIGAFHIGATHIGVTHIAVTPPEYH